MNHAHRAPTLQHTEMLAGLIGTRVRAAVLGEDPALEGAGHLVPSGESVFIALYGPLGAGKTAFTRALVGALEPRQADQVCSPSFAIVHRYDGGLSIRHYDLYRLETIQDLEEIGYRDDFFGPGVTIVEWADRIPQSLPRRRLDVRMAFDGREGRRVVLEPHGSRYCELLRDIALQIP